jgi:hypothetical protein
VTKKACTSVFPWRVYYWRNADIALTSLVIPAKAGIQSEGSTALIFEYLVSSRAVATGFQPSLE